MFRACLYGQESKVGGDTRRSEDDEGGKACWARPRENCLLSFWLRAQYSQLHGVIIRCEHALMAQQMYCHAGVLATCS